MQREQSSIAESIFYPLSAKERRQEELYRQLLHELKGIDLGTDHSKLINTWLKSSLSLKKTARCNIDAIKILNETDPTLCNKLKKIYNIDFFGRYPLEVLLEQASEKSCEDNRPYGILAAGKKDFSSVEQYSDSFFHPIWQKFIRKFYKNLQLMGISLKIFEFDGMIDLTRMFENLEIHTPLRSQAEFLLISSHADQDGFSCLETDIPVSRNGIFIEPERWRELVQLARRQLNSNAPVILDACQGGLIRGHDNSITIAGVIQTDFQRKVIGSPVDNAIREINIKRDPTGKLEFDISYNY